MWQRRMWIPMPAKFPVADQTMMLEITKVQNVQMNWVEAHMRTYALHSQAPEHTSYYRGPSRWNQPSGHGRSARGIPEHGRVASVSMQTLKLLWTMGCWGRLYSNNCKTWELATQTTADTLLTMHALKTLQNTAVLAADYGCFSMPACPQSHDCHIWEPVLLCVLQLTTLRAHALKTPQKHKTVEWEKERKKEKTEKALHALPDAKTALPTWVFPARDAVGLLTPSGQLHGATSPLPVKLQEGIRRGFQPGILACDITGPYNESCCMPVTLFCPRMVLLTHVCPLRLSRM